MEKLPLLVHGKAITDQKDEDNVEAEHRLRWGWKRGRIVATSDAAQASDGPLSDH
jgi:hypothetical protein